MTCRCPACDQVLILDYAVTPDMILSCERCDRGFRARDTRCEECHGVNPLVRIDYETFRCASCGVTQLDPAARISA